MGIWMKGKETADELAAEIGTQVGEWKAKGHSPLMAVMLVKGDPASAYYAGAKRRIAERLGIGFELHEFEPDVSAAELLGKIAQWNADGQVHGIMVELPLPKHLDAALITAAINPDKDVDGVTPANKLALLAGAEGIYPATPLACIRLLKQHGFSLEGKHAVIIGRGETVGKPLAQLLLREQATVTVCHSRTADLARHIRQADVLFTAAGRRGLVTADMVHGGLVIVDAGINEAEEGRIAGDVMPEAAETAMAMSPVPGGVGAVTTMMLFRNLMLGMSRQLSRRVIDQKEEERPFEQTIRSFLAAAASSAPTPGGGGVAAVACALGAAMGAMTARLSMGPKYAEWERLMKDAAVRLDAIAADCEAVASEDAVSFRQYMEALKLPKATAEEKAFRKQALGEAAVRATEVPLKLIGRCSEALEVIDGMKACANPNVVSDLGIGALLAEAAAQSALLTVRINLPSIPDADLRQTYKNQAEQLTQSARRTKGAITAAAEHRIQGD